MRLLEYGPAGTELAAFGEGEVIGYTEGDALGFGGDAKDLYVVSSLGEGKALRSCLRRRRRGQLWNLSPRRKCLDDIPV